MIPTDGSGIWQSVFGIVALALGFAFAMLESYQYGVRPRLRTLFYWLGVLSFGLSLFPLGAYLGSQFRPEFIWGLVVSGGVSLGSIAKAIKDGLKDQKPPDIQKTSPKILLCVLGVSLGFAAEIAWGHFHPPAPKEPPVKIRT